MRMKKLLVALGVFVAVTCFSPNRVNATVSNTVVSTTTAYGNGVTVNFTPTFDFRSNSWLTVTEYDTSTNPATVTSITQGAGAGKFTVTGGNPGTTVVMGTAPTNTQYLVIGRSIPLTQPVVMNASSIFPYQGLASQLDAMTLEVQNLNAGIGGGTGGGGGGTGGSGNLPSPGAAYDFIGWDATGLITTNLTQHYDGGQSTFQTGDILRFNGAGWSTYLLDAPTLMGTLNSGTTPLGAGAGGSGVSNSGLLTWGSNALTFTTSGVTNITLPQSGTVLTGTATNNNSASTIVKRDSSGNFSAGTISANLTGNVSGNVTGNLTGNASGTAANVTGVVALGNGGTGQTTAQAAINSLLNSGAAAAGTFARYDGANVSLGAIGIGDVPTGFARSKLAHGTANTIVMNDGSGNLFDLAGGSAGNCVQFNGVTWVSATCGGGPLIGVTYYGVDTGLADAYVVTTSSTPGAYAPGVLVSFIAAHSNTTASTINLDAIGVVGLKKIVNGSVAAVAPGDILAGALLDATYDGTQFIITSGLNPSPSVALVSMSATGNIPVGQFFTVANCAAPCTLTLPPLASTVGAGQGIFYDVKVTGAGVVTVAGAAAETVDGAATAVLNFTNSELTLTASSLGWLIR